MWWYSGKINENYSWEICFFHRRRDLKDGIDFFNLKVELSRWRADHNPQFDLHLVILNYTIFQLNIINNWHIDDPRSPYYDELWNEDDDVWDEAITVLKKHEVFKAQDSIQGKEISRDEALKGLGDPKTWAAESEETYKQFRAKPDVGPNYEKDNHD
jgi:hypothetical protein